MFFSLASIVLLAFGVQSMHVTQQQPPQRHTLSDASEPTAMHVPKYNFTWPCASLPVMPKATNVRQLRPSDIKVVMAVGDSMTAGFAMKADHAYDIWDLYSNLLEYRGAVYSVGGDAGAVTVPNFLARYAANGAVPVGASVGTSFPLDAIKWEGHIVQPHAPDTDRLNAAQSMAKVSAGPAQVDYLEQQLKLYAANGTIDFDNDWKLLTILMGANNVCGSCGGGSIYHPTYFGQQLDLIVSKATKQIPRVFINVITMFNISQVYDMHLGSLYCLGMWDTFCSHECGCLTDAGSTNATRTAMNEHSVAFNQQIYAVAQKYASMNSPNFTVSVQPFTENMLISELAEVSELDCFHPSLMANEGFAVGLWNNMQQAPGKKDNALSPLNVKILCPNKNTFFQ